MSEHIYNTLWELFVDAKQCSTEHKSQILVADDPKRLLIGFICDSCQKHFCAKLSQITSRRALVLPFDDENIQESLMHLIKNGEGRLKIAELLSYNPNGEQDLSTLFGKYWKLKVFW